MDVKKPDRPAEKRKMPPEPVTKELKNKELAAKKSKKADKFHERDRDVIKSKKDYDAFFKGLVEKSNIPANYNPRPAPYSEIEAKELKNKLFRGRERL